MQLPRERDGLLVLCSDGLWNYAPQPDFLARLAREVGPDADAQTIARHLAAFAYNQGGQDNITVAVVRLGDLPPPRAPARQPDVTHRHNNGNTHIGEATMSFTIETYQNKYLPSGGDRVDAVLSVTAPGAAAVPASQAETMIGLIVDTSGSMSGDRIEAVKYAAENAINLMDETITFFVVTFQGSAQVIVPPGRATRDAKMAAAMQLRRLGAYNGTAMSSGLGMARSLFERYPNAIRQAIFLTDGKNESEPSANVTIELQRCAGKFECDCWGVGTDWQVGEVQEIARALLGKASLIPDASGIAQAFGAAVEKAKAKATKDVRLAPLDARGRRGRLLQAGLPYHRGLHQRYRGNLPPGAPVPHRLMGER